MAELTSEIIEDSLTSGVRARSPSIFRQFLAGLSCNKMTMHQTNAKRVRDILQTNEYTKRHENDAEND